MIAMELNYDVALQKHEFDAMYPKLNSDQQAAFIAILQSVNADQGKCFFVDGYGGTGKTFLWQVLCLKLRSEKKIVLCVASSGIAALLMAGGRTAHSRFFIPIDCDSTSTCHIDQGSELAQLLQKTSLIIWDEACMSHKHNIEAVDRTLRDILRIKDRRSAERTFGGLTVVFGGDFRQTLPVVPKGTRNQILNASIKKSYIWEHIIVLKLTQNMRLRRSMAESASESEEISAFSSWILQIGDGINSNVFGESTIKIPSELCIQPIHDPISDVVKSTYPDLSTCYSDYKYLVERAILAPHHEAVSAINSQVLLEFPGEPRCYLSSDSIEVDPGQPNIMESDYSTEFLNSLKVGNFPDHELKLKIGCPVILLRNLDQSIGLVNGTRLVVTKMGSWFIEVQILTGTSIGERVFLPRLKLSERYKSLHFTLVRRQYPIALSFAMTINKSQGQTLHHVGLYLHKQVFCHGQLYVLSRVTRKAGIKIYSCNTDGEHTLSMQNVIYKEILD
ncbi:unnamed protein product [Linum trigynum]|uniref:ATP-dependent DNA helicase n=1 Tax=Linum trigynum TaxID=586398 RepID=A0AAV2GUJ2_9ROSI